MTRKAISGLVICTLLLGVLVGCAQENRTLTPIQTKDTEQMIVTASQNTTELVGQTLQESLGVPVRVEEPNLPTKSRKFSVAISADISVPKTDQLSIYKVSSAELSEAFVANAFDYFCKGQTMYNYGKLTNTREQIEGRIGMMQRDLDNNDSPDGPNSGDAWRKEYEAEIARLKTELSNAPEDLGEPIQSARLEPDEAAGGGTYDRFMAVNATKYPFTMELFAWNNVAYPTDEVRYIEGMDTTVAPRSEASFHFNDTRRISGVLFRVKDVTNEARIAELSTTPAEAMAKSTSLLDALGVSGMKPYRVILAREFDENTSATGKYAYFVQVCRTVDGITVLSPYARTYVGGLDDGHEWAYETLDIRMDDEGIIGMNWVSPLTVGAVEVERANLLPFSSILDVAKTMLVVANEPLESDLNGYDQVAIQIDRITLSLQRVPNADSINDGLLIPAWNFYGTQRYILAGGTETQRGLDEPIDSIDQPFLSINAIDGTVIDKTHGY
ncbi:MAG TPA: DUF6034 family protein [Clostridia bacterium]|nr:DUF6034 family protein [Clostridia bacterium]